MGRAFVPWDSIDAFFPQTQFVVRSLLHGDRPWWDPYVFGGMPVLGDPQSMIFTPNTLTGLIAGEDFPLRLFDLTTLGSVLCGGIALYKYALEEAKAPALPLLGALVFIMGGVATSRLQHVPQILSYALLPALLLAVRAVCARASLGRTALLAFLIAGSLLNPNQVVFLAAFMLLPLFSLHVLKASRPLRSVLALAAAGAIALLATAPVLTAVLETVQLSTRASMSIDDSSWSSFPALTLASMILPGLFGVDAGSRENIWAPNDLALDYLYVGVVPAIVILLWPLLRRDRAPAIVWICQAMLAICFLFAMGTNGPLYPILYEYGPGFNLFRRPADSATS
jgi:hypothetical protein